MPTYIQTEKPSIVSRIMKKVILGLIALWCFGFVVGKILLPIIIALLIIDLILVFFVPRTRPYSYYTSWGLIALLVASFIIQALVAYIFAYLLGSILMLALLFAAFALMFNIK